MVFMTQSRGCDSGTSPCCLASENFLVRALFLFSPPIFGGAVEAGGSYVEGEELGVEMRRGRGRSVVVGVRIGKTEVAVDSSGVHGLMDLAGATDIVEFWESNGSGV